MLVDNSRSITVPDNFGLPQSGVTGSGLIPVAVACLLVMIYCILSHIAWCFLIRL